jgi:hypothetical protein
LCRFLWLFSWCSSCVQSIFLRYKQLQPPNFSPTCLVIPHCLWGASVGVGLLLVCVFSRSSPNPLACVLHDFLLMLLVILSWCFKGMFFTILSWCSSCVIYGAQVVFFHSPFLMFFMNKKFCYWCYLVILLMLLIS